MRILLISSHAAASLLRVALVLTLDAGMVFASASILWNNAGTTVANGGWVGQMLCLAVVTLSCVLRNVLTRFSRSPRDAIAIATGDILLLVLTIAIWQRTADYYLGWIACFGAFLLLSASLCQFLAALIDQARPAAIKDRAHTSRAQRLAKTSTIRLATLAIAISLLVAVGGIHDWKLQIVDVLLLLTGSSVLLAAAITSWIGALWPHRERLSEASAAD